MANVWRCLRNNTHSRGFSSRTLPMTVPMSTPRSIRMMPRKKKKKTMSKCKTHPTIVMKTSLLRRWCVLKEVEKEREKSPWRKKWKLWESSIGKIIGLIDSKPIA